MLLLARLHSVSAVHERQHTRGHRGAGDRVRGSWIRGQYSLMMCDQNGIEKQEWLGEKVLGCVLKCDW